MNGIAWQRSDFQISLWPSGFGVGQQHQFAGGSSACTLLFDCNNNQALLLSSLSSSIASSQLVLQSWWRMPPSVGHTFNEASALVTRLSSHSRAGPSNRAESPQDHWQFELLSTGGGSGASSRLAGLHLAHGVQSAKHGRAHLQGWVQRRPEDARRFVAGAFAGAAAAAARLRALHGCITLAAREHMLCTDNLVALARCWPILCCI